MNKTPKQRVNIGCGRTPTEGWVNFDNSPAIKLSKRPALVKVLKFCGLLKKENIANIEWNKSHSVQFADASQIPLPDESVNVLYSSHMFEHLTYEVRDSFLSEAMRVLEKGGVLRIAIPDLQTMVENYKINGDADRFVKSLLIVPEITNSWMGKLRFAIVGNRGHKWMYDGQSLKKVLTDAGFEDVEVMPAGTTKIPEPGNLNLRERESHSVYVEGIKPSR